MAFAEQVIWTLRIFYLLFLEQIYDWVLMWPLYKAAIYSLAIVAGSFMHEFLPLPQSYLSNKRNVFNVYFVKFGWGWTLGLLIPFISLTSSGLTAGFKYLRMAVGTFGWYFWVNLFVYIEELTGHCEGEETLSSKKTCHLQGFHWDGFDICGYAFLLTYSALVISEEIQVNRWWPRERWNTRRTTWFDRSLLVELLFICISLLLVLWEFMLVCTSVYFHTVNEKVLGALVALFTWYVIYRYPPV